MKTGPFSYFAQNQTFVVFKKLFLLIECKSHSFPQRPASGMLFNLSGKRPLPCSIVTTSTANVYLGCKMDQLRPSEYPSQKMIPKRKIAMQVLVVEGNSGISQVLSAFLRCYGHVVDEAYDGSEAIRQLQSSRYDIVITDSEIISVDGPELCKFIKSHFRDIYVIGISGYLSALKDLKDAGADICFSKPFDINYLKRAIDCITSLRGPSA